LIDSHSLLLFTGIYILYLTVNNGFLAETGFLLPSFCVYSNDSLETLNMKFLATVLGLAFAVNAHTLFTTLFIDGENQGDGTCVRQPNDASKANSPIYPITGDVMACGM
jgi:hypothetical protein